MRLVCLCLLALPAVAACADRSGSSETRATTDPVVPPQPPRPAHEATEAQPDTTRAHMKDHFARAVAIRDAVVRGDYEATREPARWLAEHGAPKDIPDSWIQHVTELRVLSAALDEAENIEEVGRALGPVARSCGDCHAKLGVDISYVVGSVPTGDAFEAEMQKHKWAADRLWKGLAIPHDLAWERGAEHIASAGLRPKTMSNDTAANKQVLALIARLTDLGRQARDAKDGAQRATLYGELLTTCGSCHRLTKSP